VQHRCRRPLRSSSPSVNIPILTSIDLLPVLPAILLSLGPSPCVDRVFLATSNPTLPGAVCRLSRSPGIVALRNPATGRARLQGYPSWTLLELPDDDGLRGHRAAVLLARASSTPQRRARRVYALVLFSSAGSRCCASRAHHPLASPRVMSSHLRADRLTPPRASAFGGGLQVFILGASLHPPVYGSRPLRRGWHQPGGAWQALPRRSGYPWLVYAASVLVVAGFASSARCFPQWDPRLYEGAPPR